MLQTNKPRAGAGFQALGEVETARAWTPTDDDGATHIEGAHQMDRTTCQPQGRSYQSPQCPGCPRWENAVASVVGSTSSETNIGSPGSISGLSLAFFGLEGEESAALSPLVRTPVPHVFYLHVVRTLSVRRRVFSRSIFLFFSLEHAIFKGFLLAFLHFFFSRVRACECACAFVVCSTHISQSS